MNEMLRTAIVALALPAALLAGRSAWAAELSSEQVRAVLRSLMTFCNLRGANLRGANFFRVKLGGADLTGADVTGANFAEADLEGTVFRDAKGFVNAMGLDQATNASLIRR
jgi:uncharacterized protein YjbI with pentapeptide repeats